MLCVRGVHAVCETFECASVVHSASSRRVRLSTRVRATASSQFVGSTEAVRRESSVVFEVARSVEGVRRCEVARVVEACASV